MNSCDWCERQVSELNTYTDAIGDTHNICSKCYEHVKNCTCRKCNNVTDPNMLIDGLCTTCVQVKMAEKSRRQEEIRMGVDRELLSTLNRDITFTKQDYERWLTFGQGNFTPEQLKNSRELKRLWILVKLNAAGIYDNEVISSHMKGIERLLDTNLSKLINNACRILIGNTAETRKIVRESEVIDYEDDIYILKV